MEVYSIIFLPVLLKGYQGFDCLEDYEVVSFRFSSAFLTQLKSASPQRVSNAWDDFSGIQEEGMSDIEPGFNKTRFFKNSS